MTTPPSAGTASPASPGNSGSPDSAHTTATSHNAAALDSGTASGSGTSLENAADLESAASPGSRPAPGTTSTAPSARRLWTRSRGILLALLVLVAAAVTTAVLQSKSVHGSLDPRSADPGGSRAVAELLADRGVSTRVVTTLDDAVAAAGPDTTLLIAGPDLLTAHQQDRLRAATAASGGRTVLVAPGIPSVGTLAPGVLAEASTDHRTLDPRCTLAEARRAGNADTGDHRYSTTAHDADACYPADGLPTLLRVPASAGDKAGDIVVLGSRDILVNDHLGRHGNASLALQLLGSRPHLVWYLPSLADPSTASESGSGDFVDLIPGGWLWGTLQLFIAAALAALWRARRFGPLVPERLPVVIRASETAEGRARLYRRNDARDRAADALRSATRSRLAPLVGIPLTQAHTPEALLPALSARLGDDGPWAARTNAPSPHDLLFGPPPRDDAALVQLADHLDALEREVRRP